MQAPAEGRADDHFQGPDICGVRLNRELGRSVARGQGAALIIELVEIGEQYMVVVRANKAAGGADFGP